MYYQVEISARGYISKDNQSKLKSFLRQPTKQFKFKDLIDGNASKVIFCK